MDLERCRRGWQRATARERQQLCALEAPEELLYVHVAHETLTERRRRDVAGAAASEARRAEGLSSLVYDGEERKRAWLTLEAREAADAFDALVARPEWARERCDELLRYVAGGVFLIDYDSLRLEGGRAATWRALGRDVYTLLLSAALRRCERWNADTAAMLSIFSTTSRGVLPSRSRGCWTPADGAAALSTLMRRSSAGRRQQVMTQFWMRE